MGESKKMISSLEGVSTSNVSTKNAIISSATAGALASVITNPLDLAKLRLQTQRAVQRGEQSDVNGTFIGPLRSVWQQQGLRGFFRGSGARVAFHVPSTCI